VNDNVKDEYNEEKYRPLLSKTSLGELAKYITKDFVFS